MRISKKECDKINTKKKILSMKDIVVDGVIRTRREFSGISRKNKHIKQHVIEELNMDETVKDIEAFFSKK